MGSNILIGFLLLAFLVVTSAGNFNQDFVITWGDGRGKILNNGQLLTLSMDKYSGSGFRSKNKYVFGRFDMQLKLVPGNSAGTVTTFYLSSLGNFHDEIDFEFLGNSSGDPYTVHTNIWVHGQGGREQRFRLWFDPTKDFHTYSILWNPLNIILFVDGTPLRVFKNLESRGIPFPKSQGMNIISSLWDADNWATRGGKVKTDWTKAPFIASYRNSNIQASWRQPWMKQTMNSKEQVLLRWVQKNHMIYSYCNDHKKYPRGFPPECKLA